MCHAVHATVVASLSCLSAVAVVDAFSYRMLAVGPTTLKRGTTLHRESTLRGYPTFYPSNSDGKCILLTL